MSGSDDSDGSDAADSEDDQPVGQQQQQQRRATAATALQGREPASSSEPGEEEDGDSDLDDLGDAAAADAVTAAAKAGGPDDEDPLLADQDDSSAGEGSDSDSERSGAAGDSEDESLGEAADGSKQQQHASFLEGGKSASFARAFAKIMGSKPGKAASTAGADVILGESASLAKRKAEVLAEEEAAKVAKKQRHERKQRGHLVSPHTALRELRHGSRCTPLSALTYASGPPIGAVTHSLNHSFSYHDQGCWASCPAQLSCVPEGH